jgi:hypothetical protein
MDLIYKIYSVYLYDNQLNHDWLFFYNRKTDFMGNVNRDAPYLMFSSSYDISANTQIFRMDKTAPDFLEQSVRLMKDAAKRSDIELIPGKDIITLVPCGESRISYSGALPGDVVETEGKYKGLKKSVYTPYDVMFNETKAGFNPHEFDVMGIWNTGSSQYSNYRIWEEKAERESRIRDYKLQELLNENSLY